MTFGWSQQSIRLINLLIFGWSHFATFVVGYAIASRGRYLCYSEQTINANSSAAHVQRRRVVDAFIFSYSTPFIAELNCWCLRDVTKSPSITSFVIFLAHTCGQQMRAGAGGRERINKSDSGAATLILRAIAFHLTHIHTNTRTHLYFLPDCAARFGGAYK